MNKTALLLVVLLGTTASASALAQGASLRGAGLLAVDTTESHANAVVEMIDSGGGSTGARALRGSDASPRARGDAERVAPVPDPLPEKLIGDPAAPAAATPKRPTYRWQSLVPGAIK